MNVLKLMMHAILMRHVPMRMAVTPAAAIPVLLEVGNNVLVSLISGHVKSIIWPKIHSTYVYITMTTVADHNYETLYSIDIDECAEGSGLASCDINATCINTVGGFECVCNEGFEGTGTICTGIATPCLYNFILWHTMTIL